MHRFRRTPLAWQNLTHDKRRLLIAVAGVTFAAVLMFVERGFQNALFDSTVSLVKHLDADILINCRSRYSLSASSRFPANLLMLARSCEGVAAASPVYVESYQSVLRKPDQRSRPIRVVAFDLRQSLLTPDMQQAVDRYREVLSAPRTALIDTKSKAPIYGVDPTAASPEDPVEVELADRPLQLVGTFELGTDFASDGTLLMNAENFSEYFPLREFPANPLTTVDLGVVTCEAGASASEVAARLQQRFGELADVRTRAQFVADEIEFWDQNTPIGAIFQVGVIMGFVVGVLICYQVLFNDISDHMPEFATLMAMGYSSPYFVSLVVRESIYLALFGFIPGVGISWCLFQLISHVTGLTMSLSFADATIILGFTLTMCVISGLLAVRKLLAADPASLF